MRGGLLLEKASLFVTAETGPLACIHSAPGVPNRRIQRQRGRVLEEAGSMEDG